MTSSGEKEVHICNALFRKNSSDEKPQGSVSYNEDCFVTGPIISGIKSIASSSCFFFSPRLLPRSKYRICSPICIKNAKIKTLVKKTVKYYSPGIIIFVVKIQS
jgi:hypothetical protein